MSIEKNANQPTFLDGWKEISNYLGKGVRTAQRYEQELGLPIRRTVGCGPLKQLFTGFSIEGHETVGVDVGHPGILVSPTFRGEQPPRKEHPNHCDRNKQCRNPTFKQILLIALEIRISRVWKFSTLRHGNLLIRTSLVSLARSRRLGMGPNGVRVRDWVEIDGVGGEVVKLGLFRTWLLETGNWTAHGHPTGRRVSFLNGYAICGKYFNFSTVGQWMWDEIKVNVPPGTSIHRLLKGIYGATAKTTEADAQMAEAEWKRVTHEEGTPHFSAMPSVNLRPAGAGVDIIIRYITRAGVRVETRNHLFAMIVDLMQGESKDDTNRASLSPQVGAKG